MINNLLLIFGILTALSGLVLQLGFHMGGPEEHQVHTSVIHSQTATYEQVRGFDTDRMIWGFNYFDWSTIHKTSIVILSLLMVYHFYAHWKWYIGVIKKHLIRKNIQVMTLTILFLLVAVTGLIPWFIDLSDGTYKLRYVFIEIHDKITFLLIIYLVLHIIKRTKWYGTAYERMKG